MAKLGMDCISNVLRSIKSSKLEYQPVDIDANNQEEDNSDKVFFESDKIISVISGIKYLFKILPII